MLWRRGRCRLDLERRFIGSPASFSHPNPPDLSAPGTCRRMSFPCPVVQRTGHRDGEMCLAAVGMLQASMSTGTRPRGVAKALTLGTAIPFKWT